MVKEEEQRRSEARTMIAFSINNTKNKSKDQVFDDQKRGKNGGGVAMGGHLC